MEPHRCCGNLPLFFKIQNWVFTLALCSRGHDVLQRNPISEWSVAKSILMLRKKMFKICLEEKHFPMKN